METYTVVIEQRQYQVVQLPVGVEFDEDIFWEDYYDLGSCTLDSTIVAVDKHEEEKVKLFKLVYTQENEAYIEAENEQETVEKIRDFTENGSQNMYMVRLNSAGWSVEDWFDDIEPIGERLSKTEADKNG